MKRIKDLTKAMLGMNDVLLKVHTKKFADIILPNSDNKAKGPQFDYATILAKGSAVGLDVNDIVIDVTITGKEPYYEIDGVAYMISNCHSIHIAVKPDNFINNKEDDRILNLNTKKNEC